MTALARGQSLGQRFQLDRRLGEGGMGEVWLAEDRELQDRVVVKVVSHGDGEASEEEIALLRRECRNARRLVHPNIVPVYDFHHDSSASFITMAHVEGENIGALRGRPLEEILPRLASIAGALAYAHREGIVHRDLKASNVLIDPSGEPRIVDFGIAGLLEREQKARIELRGGGVEGAASPEQLGGSEPSPRDDIYAFGMLARDLTGGLALPARLEALLTSATHRDPRHRPRSMSEVKEELEAVRQETRPKAPSAISVRPPPRIVAPIEPSPFGPKGSLASLSRRPGGAARTGRIGWKTAIAFSGLLVLAGVVFFALPRWVAEKKPPSTQAAEVAPPARPPEEPVADLEELAQAKARAMEVRERAAALRAALEPKGVEDWGGPDHRSAVTAMTEGDDLMRQRLFEEAATRFQEAATSWEAVEAHGEDVAAAALRRGREALAAGRAAEAAEAFGLAARIQPKSAAAKTGLRRAELLDEVTALVARGEELEAQGLLRDAAESYRKAAALDPLTKDALRGLERVDARTADETFTAAMTEAVAALNARDFAAARKAYERAGAIRKDAPEVTDGLKAVVEGEKLEAIAEHRDEAAAFEKQEAWRSAEKHYQAVLGLDPTIRFAQEGKKRAASRAALSEKIQWHLGHPERLSDENVLEEASSLLEDAKAVSAPGPRWKQSISKLDALVDEYSTPVEIYLLSDEKTDVVVYKVGRIGKFHRRVLTLRPGTYTVVGTRKGYRDVRLKLVVSADRPPEPLVVRCEEAI